MGDGDEEPYSNASPNGIHLPPLSNSTPLNRDSSSHDEKKNGTEWYWQLSKNLPELWIRNAHKIDDGQFSKLEKAWSHYRDLRIPDGEGRNAKKYQQREALKKKYAKIENPDVKAAHEVALARYKYFAYDGETGKLDYLEHPADKMKKNKGGKGTCTVM
jgi:hypothetical protein